MEVTKEEQERCDKMEAERKLRNTAWQDLTVEQKMERMREQIKNSRSGQQSQLTEHGQSIDKLKGHSHQDNKIVIPLEENRRGLNALCGTSRMMPEGKEYF